ncbi:MAG: hypothetical protein AAF564_10705 [Bacteroidota bacterium]
MTNQKKRSLEHEINARLYRNLTREGIPMDHLDPTHLASWPLLEHQSANKGDYVNLLPPSYRNPFQQEISAVTQQRRQADKKSAAQGQDFRTHLASEWSISDEPEIVVAEEPQRSGVSLLLITIAGLLMAASLALNSTFLPALFF